MATAPHLRPLTLDDYLALPEDGDREREIIGGRLFVAPRPLPLHQVFVAYLLEVLTRYVLRRKGRRAQLVPDADLLMDAHGSYVSPDLMYFSAETVPALLEILALGRRIHVSQARPALVVEVLSPGSETRDLVEKARDYAAAGIPHYWAVDPARRAFYEFWLPLDQVQSAKCKVQSEGDRGFHRGFGAGAGEYESTAYTIGRFRPRLFADERPPLTIDLNRLWTAPQA
ncbi:MAG: Uma2 family endonuclease [Chloroflexi bacterium]|nr:Uma2 family endonuclease [Chloroflexota bacterium]